MPNVRVVIALLLLLAGAPLYAQSRVVTRDVRDVVPPNVQPEQIVLTRDSERTYYRTAAGDVWLFDRVRKSNARVVTGNIWDINVSPARSALAFTKAGETRTEQYVWVVPIEPRTGLASGPERRLSAQQGDVPSISPDGQWVAFARNDSTGVGQSIVVAPVGGGAERVVAPAQPSGIGGIWWTPDGGTLFFAVNPPVPFTCAESCISLAANPQVPGTIRRVPVAGGPVSVIANTGALAPGLSPDGTTLVFADTGRVRRFIVADPNGRQLETFTLPPTQTPVRWLEGSTLLTIATGMVIRLQTVAVSGGSPRILFEHTNFMLEPFWSPDGKIISVLRLAGDHCEFRMLNADGTLRKVIALPGNGWGAPAWTADQRAVVFMRYPQNGAPVVTLVDIATEQTKVLRETTRGAEVEWVLRADGVTIVEMSAPAAGKRQVEIRHIALDGATTLIRELSIDGKASIVPLDRARGLLVRNSPLDVRRIRLDADGGDALLFPPRTSGFVFQRMSFSADRQWLALRVNPSGSEITRMNSIELTRIDGTERRTVALPFFAEYGDNPVVLPGANELIVVERRRANPDPGVYVVNTATGAARKLFDYTGRGRNAAIVLSPDGRTLLSLASVMLTPTVSAMDFSRVR